MERVQENEGYLRLIAKTTLKRGRRLITEATAAQLDSICEVILNVIKGTLSVPNTLIQKAKKYQKSIRQLASRYLGPRVRKRLMLRYLPIIKKILAVAVPLCTILASVTQLT